MTKPRSYIDERAEALGVDFKELEALLPSPFLVKPFPYFFAYLTAPASLRNKIRKRLTAIKPTVDQLTELFSKTEASHSIRSRIYYRIYDAAFLENKTAAQQTAAKHIKHQRQVLLHRETVKQFENTVRNVAECGDGYLVRIRKTSSYRSYLSYETSDTAVWVDKGGGVHNLRPPRLESAVKLARDGYNPELVSKATIKNQKTITQALTTLAKIHPEYKVILKLNPTNEDSPAP